MVLVLYSSGRGTRRPAKGTQQPQLRRPRRAKRRAGGGFGQQGSDPCTAKAEPGNPRRRRWAGSSCDATGPEAEGRGVGRRRRPAAATDGGGDGGDGRRCDPVSSPNVKGRGASPATPWYVPTIVAFG